MSAQRLDRSHSDFGQQPALGPGHNIDPVAAQAEGFARKLNDVTGIASAPRMDETDSAQVNANIAMVAKEADNLITALIENAEDQGLEASGDWMKVPLVETRAFEVPAPDPEAAAADDEYDRKMNS